MRAQQPELEQRDDSVDPRQRGDGQFGVAVQPRDAMAIAVRLQAVVAVPAVGVDLGAGFDRSV